MAAVGLVGAAVALAMAAPPARVPVSHPFVPPEGGDAACAQCHAVVEQQAHVHTALRAGCRSCHGLDSGRAGLLRAAVNGMCLACHGRAALPVSSLVRIALAADYEISAEYGATKRIALDARGVGHPIAGHPVSGGSDPLRSGLPLTCVSCHLPHGAPDRHLLRFQPGSDTGVCGPCHTV